MRNLYEILEISKDATENEIKSAYKKLAIKNHPDRGGDEEKFKEIANAYDILKDKNKKDLYDKYGEEGLQQGGGGHGVDPFEMFFNMNSFGGHNMNNMRNKVQKCENIICNMNITLEQLFNCSKINKKVNVNKICNICNGKGTNNDYKDEKCTDCNGNGVKMIHKRVGPGMIQQMRTTCKSCNGEGRIIKDEYKCRQCRGNKIISVEKSYNITLNSNMFNGQNIINKNCGNEYPNKKTGDIVFVVVEQQHKIFKRLDKNTLYIKKHINLAEALLGCNIVIDHVNNKKIYIELEPISKPKLIKK